MDAGRGEHATLDFFFQMHSRHRNRVSIPLMDVRKMGNQFLVVFFSQQHSRYLNRAFMLLMDVGNKRERERESKYPIFFNLYSRYRNRVSAPVKAVREGK